MRPACRRFVYLYGVSAYEEEDFLQLSGVQHFLFCRRQWALICIENQWADNLRTVEGGILHERAHREALTEKRGNSIVTRGMRVFSRRMGISGQCDVLEFHRSDAGVPLDGWEGLWQPYPVEYKRGEPKQGNYDAAQLCCQAQCLEEMLCCVIPDGALFYGETKRREPVNFTDDLREEVTRTAAEMHALYQRGHTPKVKPAKHCNACSLKALCLPSLMTKPSVADYMRENR